MIVQGIVIMFQVSLITLFQSRMASSEVPNTTLTAGEHNYSPVREVFCTPPGSWTTKQKLK